jgi:MFS family permease
VLRVIIALRARVPRGPLAVLLGAWLLVGTAGWAFSIALAVFAFDRSGSGAVGAVTAARLLPAMCGAPLAGGLIDRGDRSRVVAGACVLQAVCLALAAGLVLADASLVMIVVLAALSSIAATAPRPGLQALLPALASSPQELTRATAVWGAVDSAGFLLGGGVGGAAIAAVGAGAVVVAAAVIMVLAAVCSARLPAVTATAPDQPDEGPHPTSEMLAGLRVLAQNRLLRAPFGLLAGLLFLEGASDVQLVALAVGRLHMGNGGPGVLWTVWGAGGMLASVAFVSLVRRRGLGQVLVVGALTFTIGLGVAGLDSEALAVAAMIPAGIGFALVETTVMALIPRLADDTVIGRVYALSEILYTGAAALGALLAPLLIDRLGTAASLCAVSAAFAVAAVAAWPSSSRLDAGQQQAGRVRELLRGVPILAPLPLPRLERLVRDARPVIFTAGALVVTIGDPGEDFFVIEDGTVTVEEFDLRQGPGTGFGEIALLQHVPRTATVRAASDLRLWAVSRASFIGAVSGHRDASKLADAVVVEHLARTCPADQPKRMPTRLSGAPGNRPRAPRAAISRSGLD